MSPHLLPQPTSHRGYYRFAILRSLPMGMLRALSVAIGLGGTAGVALAGDPPLPNLPFRPAAVSDTVMARSVLAAMDADPELHGVNIVVSVVDGVAVIGGPVSSAAVAKRAEFVVRRVPDIKDVRNSCFVSSGPDPLMTALAERMGSPLPGRPGMAELPGVLTKPLPPTWGSPPTGFQSQTLVAAGSQGNGNKVVVRKPPLATVEGLGMLGAPVGTVGSGSVTAPASGRDSATFPGSIAAKLTATVPGAPPQAGLNDVLTSVSYVKKAEARFDNLTVEMRDGVIVIGGTSPRASDAWDLAEKIRQIPGVTRVVIGIGPAK